jgi:Zn-dependent protease
VEPNEVTHEYEPVAHEYDPPAHDYEPAAHDYEPAPVRGYEPIHPGTNWRQTVKRFLAPIVVVVGTAAKYGFAVAKFGSIFLAFGGYALLWGWQFAAGLIALILAHEMGHYIEARRWGMHPKLPVFVLVGAYVKLRNEGLTPWKHAWIALAGPFLGSVAAAMIWAAGQASNSDMLRAIGFTGFVLNLFNLIPIGFLDGGHVLQSFTYLYRGGAKDRAAVVGVAYATLALLLAAAVIRTHVPQHRL